MDCYVVLHETPHDFSAEQASEECNHISFVSDDLKHAIQYCESKKNGLKDNCYFNICLSKKNYGYSSHIIFKITQNETIKFGVTPKLIE